MALIKCPECGKDVSSIAKSCPNCGCPIESNNQSGYCVTLAVQVIGSVLLGAFINTAVASVTQAITEDIQKKGGKVTNVKNGALVPIPLMTTQTVMVFYEAPNKIYEKNCTVQITKPSFSKPQFKWIWQ